MHLIVKLIAMKINYIKVSAWIMSGAMTLLGFSSCDNLIEPRCEYGTPHAKYTVKGRVTNEQGVAIPGIQVIIERSGNPLSSRVDIANQTSGSSGEFAKSFEYVFPENQNFTLKFSDIDGPANGVYKAKTQSFVIPLSELKGGDKSWYSGEAVKEVVVKLEE
jgi:putative lipoprotein (rSAM/lipoprotein system)